MASEFVASTATKAVGNLATEYASPNYVSYFFHFGKIVKEFKNQRKELELKKDRVKNDVDTAIRQVEVIEKDDQEWLKEAEKELEDAQSLEAEIERKKCISWCPSWGWQYSLSKKVAKKTSSISKLLQRCDFQRVGIRPPLQGIELFPSEDSMSFESSNATFNGIITALNTNGVNMIGLYGMPGVGKTTLAKQVGKHAKEQKLFDNVVMVTMSQTPNISNIQARIAELLGLKFETSKEKGKAEELWRGLKKVKKILIIFDDVWKNFELQTIGIPFGVGHEGCKILLTTRLQQVCVEMDCQKTFELHVLSEVEAWALFKDNAGLTNATSPLNDVAKEVASECKGLPLAIVTLGKALKGEDLSGWRIANQRLKESRHLDNEDVYEDVYNCLKLSYDYLKGDDLQSCFLLCSLFSEDSYISIERLIMLAIGHGLFSNVYSIEVLRMEIGRVIRKLQEFSLLLRTDDDDDEEIYVSMHDVVRDFAHWITLREENLFMVKEWLTEWPVSENFECYTTICFWNNNIDNFPWELELEFSKLRIFVFTKSNKEGFPIRLLSTLIKGMKVLQVLYLKNVFFSLEVFKFVKNLQTLCLENCYLQNLSSLKNLKNLEILVLLDNDIHDLPEEVLALSRLKSLHFSCYGGWESRFPPNLLSLHFSCYGGWESRFPPNLLSRLTSLQELHVTCPNNINLWELNSLSHLTALSLRVSTAQCSQENFVFPKLRRYSIAVNESLRPMKGLKFRTLKIKDFSSSLSAFEELFCNVEKLTLERCNYVECLMNTTTENRPTTALFSNLVELKMKDMPRLKELCHGPLPIEFLNKLIDVSIANCELLKVVFQMDEILENEEITSGIRILSELESLHLHSLSELESIWKLQSTNQFHVDLQSLRIVTVGNCNKLKSIFSISVPLSLAQLHLQELDISYCNKFEAIFDFSQEIAEREDHIELPWLRRLTLKSLETLTTLCSRGLSIGLPSLEELEVEACPQLSICNIIRRAEVKDLRLSKMGGQLFEEIIQLDGGYLLSSLEKLKLQEISELELIFKDPSQIVTLENLSHLTVFKCSKLRNIFSVLLARNLPHLSHLEVEECGEMLQVVAQDGISSSSMASHKAVCFPNLEVVRITECKKLKSIFPVSFCRLPKLKRLEVKGAFNLREIFGHDSDASMTNNGNLKEVLLAKLEVLLLVNLPNLISFTAVGYYFIFRALICIKVKDCPRIIMRFSVHDDSEGSYVRAEIEKSKLPKEGNIESSIGIEPVGVCQDIRWLNPERKADKYDHLLRDE